MYRRPAGRHGFRSGTSMFLKLDGIRGGSQTETYEGWIDVLAWSWGLSKTVSEPKRSIKSIEAANNKKLKLIEKAGLKSQISPEEKEKMEKSGISFVPEITDYERAQEILEDYNSDDDSNPSDFLPRRAGKPKLRNISLTKYHDRSSADIALSGLTAKTGIGAVLRVVKVREVPEEKKLDENGVEIPAAAESEEEKKSSPPKKPKLEFYIIQEWVLSDCFIVSVSTGGSGGEDRLTENITLDFSGMQYRYNDYYSFIKGRDDDENDEKKEFSLPEKIPTESYIYNAVTNRGKKFDQAIEQELNQNDTLGPVKSLVMGYM